MSKKAFALLLSLVFIVSLFLWADRTSSGESWLQELSRGGSWILPLVVVASLVDSINPCAISVLLLTIAFLFSIGKLRERIFLIGGVYILGIFIVYTLIGLGILHVLQVFSIPNFMGKVGASILILVGTINLINEFFPKFPIKLKIPDAAHHPMAVMMEKASIPAAFFLGVLVALFEFPCTGGPYLLVLGLLHDQATFMKGFGYLLIYNFIFVLPLLIILFVASDKKLVNKFREWQEREDKMVGFWSGIAMIILGLIIFIIA